MVFTRFVEVGRIVLLNHGPLNGKLAVIVDVVDQTRALIDGPGLARAPYNFKSMALLPYTIPIKRGQRMTSVKGIWEKEEVEKKFAASAWGKKLAAKAARANSTDFDRFKAMLAKKKRSAIIHKEELALKKKASKK